MSGRIRIEDDRDLRAEARGDALAAKLAAVEAERERLRGALTIAAAGFATVRNNLPESCEAVRVLALDNFKAARAALGGGR